MKEKLITYALISVISSSINATAIINETDKPVRVAIEVPKISSEALAYEEIGPGQFIEGAHLIRSSNESDLAIEGDDNYLCIFLLKAPFNETYSPYSLDILNEEPSLMGTSKKVISSNAKNYENSTVKIKAVVERSRWGRYESLHLEVTNPTPEEEDLMVKPAANNGEV